MDTLYANARIAGTDKPQDLLVEEGRFTRIGEGLARELPAQGYDMTGIEDGGHERQTGLSAVLRHASASRLRVHPRANRAPPTNQARCSRGIQRWSDTKADLTVDEVKTRARKGRGNGTAAWRAVYPLPRGRDRPESHLAQGSAGAQGGAQGRGDDPNRLVPAGRACTPTAVLTAKPAPELVEEGLRMGADCVGGIPPLRGMP